MDVVRNNSDTVLRTRPSKDVEVTVVINVHKDCPEATILRNAAEALYYKANAGSWKTWCLRYGIKIKRVFT